MFPVNHVGRPLPSIFAGDYHALHVIQSLLGNDSIELVLVSSKQANKVDKDLAKELANSDVIYLCTPHSNSELKRIAPLIEHPLEEQIPNFNGIDIPCWFANKLDEGSSKRVIWIPGKSFQLE